MCPLCANHSETMQGERLLLVTFISHHCRWNWSKDQLQCITLHLPKVVLGPAATQQTRQALDVEFPPWEDAGFCGVMVCSRELAFLRAVWVFVFPLEVMRRIMWWYIIPMASGSCFLFCSPLACYSCRKQAGLSMFEVWCRLRMPVNKAWNERD